MADSVATIILLSTGLVLSLLVTIVSRLVERRWRRSVLPPDEPRRSPTDTEHYRVAYSGSPSPFPTPLRYIVVLLVMGFCLFTIFVNEHADAGVREFASFTLGSIVTVALRGVE
jgi:hypothetical protein